MIKIKNVSKIYSGGLKAVDDISFEVKKGEIFGFLGPNGAGKTTTIKMICGLLKKTSGEIIIDNIDVSKNPIEAKKKIGYVADEALLMEKLTGAEYINFIADIFEVPKETKMKRAEKLLKHFKMVDSVKSPISSYSHGMKQKIALIGALIHNPDLWVLDEPIVGLDPESAFILKKMMKNHVENEKTVFFSTHVMEVAEKLCDRLAIISKGKILFIGTVEELRKQKGDSSLEKIFLEVTNSESEKIDFSYLD
jgi:ABC-2 type transport system ATP-binding protein